MPHNAQIYWVLHAKKILHSNSVCSITATNLEIILLSAPYF